MMKRLVTVALLSLPAAALAQGMPMREPMMGGCCRHGAGGLMAGALYAVVAVLGYWVLTQAVKETSACIKRIGDVLGSILVLIGLLGLLCATFGHVRHSMCRRCSMAAASSMMAPPPPPAEKK